MTSYKKWRTIIINHYQNPTYFGFIDNPAAIESLAVHTSCADQLNLQLVIIKEHIKSARFTGYACAIATASTDLICQTISNKSKLEAIAILNNYQLMILEQSYDEQLIENLVVFAGVKQQPNRKKCALLASQGFLELLQKRSN